MLGKSEKVFNVASHRDFLGLLVDWLLGFQGLDEDPMKLSRVRVYLPNRRLTRGLKIRLIESCLGRKDKRSLVLPRIEAIGDLSITEELYDDFIDENYESDDESRTSLDPMGKSLILYRLVSSWLKIRGERNFGIEHTLGLSESLGYLLDELDLHEVEKEAIDGIVPEELSTHWQISRDFLRILRKEFPKICESRGQVNGMERRVKSLRYLADYLSRSCVSDPVIIAGSTGSIRSTAALMESVVGLPNGLLILPGLDRTISEEVWSELGKDMSHPQHGLYNILDMLKIKRHDISEWQEQQADKMDQTRRPKEEFDSARQQLLSYAMAPAISYESWSKSLESEGTSSNTVMKDFVLFEAESSGDESMYISFLLRRVLENKGERAALISPDRGLIKSVISEMRRWGVYIDDSAGEKALLSGSGLLVSILLDMLSEDSPDKILSLLHHPMCRMGFSRGEMLKVLSFISGFKRDISDKPKTIKEMKNLIERHGKHRVKDLESRTISLLFLEKLQNLFSRFFAKKYHDFQEHLENFINLCEQVSEGGGHGKSSIWRTAEGEKLAEGMVRLRTYGDLVEEKLDTISFCSMLRGLLSGVKFHERRSNQSRLMIIEPMEARLHKFDLVILGGLNEGTWPRSVVSSPWMSRSMREKLGLLSQERSVGLQAHDFMQACGAKKVVLTRAKVFGDEPRLESRWLARIKVVMKHKNISFDYKMLEETNKAFNWAKRTPKIPRYERPKIEIEPHIFPKKISVTSVDFLREDPYIFYAQKLLKLRVPQDMLGDIRDKARGIIFHKLIREVNDFSEQNPDSDEQELLNYFDNKFDEELALEIELPSILKLLWKEKWRKIVREYIQEELLPTRLSSITIASEREGEVTLSQDVTLRGTADRIDILKNGMVRIVDFKTGSRIPVKSIKSMAYSQLGLLGLIGLKGGFSFEGELFEEGFVSLYFLKNKSGGKLEVGLTECRTGEVFENWWQDAEELVVREVCQYYEAEKIIESPRVLGRNYTSWSRFNRFAEWGYDD